VEGERVQRRLAAILAADVAGYSRLTGADEEGTIARLRALRRELIDPTVAAHGGRIVKTTGDGILIEFASVVDAVRCAVEVQHCMASRNSEVRLGKEIEFRVGIHLGDVVVQGDDLLGDGVNVAARLESIAEVGGICLSGDAYRQTKGKVDLNVRDLGDQRLKNIAEPVRIYAISAASAQTGAGVLPNAQAPRLSIVVLPFANLGGDKEQDYFVDSVTENLTTDLSRIPGAFVIARNTAFTYKGKAVDARQVGRELGVRYVMEGSVQSGANRIRVNAQLIDAETGAHLWAERFDKPRADLFDMQDEITARLARTVGIELVAAEGRRAERDRPSNMDAVDLSMRGWALMNQPFSLDLARQARSLFEAALRLDDRNVDALIGLADAHLTEVRVFASADRSEQIRAAETATAKALKLSPNNAYAHYVRAHVSFVSRTPERALHEYELAIGLDRNLALAHAYAGLMKVLLGRSEETEAHISEAMRLSPRDPALGSWYNFMGAANLYLGKLEVAAECLRKSVATNPNNSLAHFFLAASLALAGRDAEAAEACAAGQQLDPTFSVARFRDATPSHDPVYLAQRERIYEGLRKAGAPEE
jgi:TolB-like protein/class 3 adenylate cyclase/Flp pilus assembly protein TadD